MRVTNSQSSMAISRHRTNATRPRKTKGVSTSTWKTIFPVDDTPPALSNPSAMSPAETAPRKTLARPFDSLIVATRCTCRL